MSSNQTSWGIMSVLFQHGVTNEPTGSQTQLNTSCRSASVTDSFKGNTERPTMLGVNAMKDYNPKHSRSGSSDSDDGSLPCTPELREDDDSGESGSAEYEALSADTRPLIQRFYSEDSGLVRPRWTDGKSLSTMKRVVGGLLERHRITYSGMISKLQLSQRGDDMSFISEVAEQMFSDGTTNWGRVASLLAFGAAVARHQKQNGKVECVEAVTQEISSYLLREKKEWLIKNNAWEGFVEFFQETDTESIVRNTLMTVVGVAGIGATLAMLIR